MLRSLAAVAAVVAVAIPAGASGNMIQPTLNAKVTARSISLTDSSGQVREDAAPALVPDRRQGLSKGQNFHLIGPAVNMKTRVAATSARTWIRQPSSRKVRLQVRQEHEAPRNVHRRIEPTSRVGKTGSGRGP